MFLIKNTFGNSFGNIFSIPLSRSSYDDLNSSLVPTSALDRMSAERLNNIQVPGLKNYGNTWLYYPNGDRNNYNEQDAYVIENIHPFNYGQFGNDFRVSRIKIVPPSTSPQLISNAVPGTRKTYDLEMTKTTSKSQTEYVLKKNNFDQSVFSEKGDLKLVLDLGVFFDENVQSISKKINTLVVIDLFQATIHNENTLTLIEVTPPSSNGTSSSTKTTFSLKVKKDISGKDKLTFSVLKDNEHVAEKSIHSVVVDNVFILFSDSPSITSEDIFGEHTEDAIKHSFSSPKSYVKRVYLDNWLNKNKDNWGSISKSSVASEGQGNQAEFEFKTDNNFWKSKCSDAFKAGGFIDSSSDPILPTATQTKDNTKTYVKQQKDLYEEFDPRTDKVSASSKSFFNPVKPYTTASPCENMDDTTKQLFKEFAKAEGQGQELSRETARKIDWNIIPQPIKNLISDSPLNDQKSKSKIIQSSFRAWGSGYKGSGDQTSTSYDALYEEAIKTEHTFELKIDKETIKSKLIDHNKLNDQSSGKKLNELPEISSQIQVSIPYSFTIYDPVSNFLHKRRVNLIMALDLRPIYNHHRFIQNFFTYDIGTHHYQIGVDYAGQELNGSTSGTPYGLAGVVDFSAGLQLDIDSNLKVQLHVNTRGFVNTKKSLCNWRERYYKINPGKETCSASSSNWSYRKHNHIPSFIVLEINEDPKISSFYADRRISGITQIAAQAPSKTASDQPITTLKEFKDKKLDQSKREQTITQRFDQTNNAEVYFRKLDVTDPSSKEQQKALSYQINDGNAVKVETSSAGFFSSAKNFLVNYYIPRRNYGEISVEDENLEEITIYLKGSSVLGGIFFQSMHYATKITYCSSSSTPSSSTPSSSSNECADGQKYDNISKDQESTILNKKQDPSVNIKWTDLKQQTQQTQQTKTFHFMTVIHRPGGGKGDTNKFDDTKTKLETLFKEENSLKPNDNSLKNKLPNFSCVGVWYSLELWYDSSNKKICYYTKVRAISAIADTTSSGKQEISNLETTKVPGASARAGFEMSKIEFKYKKTDAVS